MPLEDNHEYNVGLPDSMAASGRPGVGTVGLIRPWNMIEDHLDLATFWADTEAVQLWGIRNIRGPQIQAAPLNASHMNVVHGYTTYVPGMRDGGMIEFEANWNPTELHWQKDSDDSPVRSIMDHPAKLDGIDSVMRALLIKPASMDHAWVMTGFLTMLSTVYDMENVVMATLGFKINGRPELRAPGSLPTTLLTATI